MIRKRTLRNGISLLTETMPHVRSVSIGVWLRRGSRHERTQLNGISHFIEHLVFKGTRNRSARQIALEMDSVGGHLDAFTSKEYTCFYAKVLDAHVGTAVDLLADIVQRPLFDAEELERERKVVLEEIRMVADTPDDLIYDLFTESIYPRHPLGRPIQGTEASVAGISRRQLLGFFRTAYRPSNIVIAASGNLSHAKLLRRVEDAFGELRRGKAESGSATTTPRAKIDVVLHRKQELEQLHILLGLPAHAKRLKDRYPLYVLNALLGGTMSSRLFQSIREERGLAYSVYSGVNAFRDTGFLSIYAATHPDRGEEVVRLVRDELRDLRDRGPNEDELRVAKEHLKGSLMLGLESTSSRMSNLARSEIQYGRQLDLNETLAGIDQVNRKQVHRIADRLFSQSKLSLAAVGQIRSAAKLRKGLEL